MAKREDWICPKCESDDAECVDSEFDYDCVMRKMYCPNCEHTWREYFVIKYDGYSDDTGEYDPDGKKVL